MSWHKLALKQIHQGSLIRKGKSSIATMNLLALLVDISMGVPVNPYPPAPSSPSLLLWNKSAWIQENGMNRCGTYYLLSSHLYAFLWWLYVLSQARRFQRRRFRVALSKFLIVWKRVFELFARLQTRDINGMSPNPFTWRWQFFLLVEKKSRRYLLSAYVGMDFSCKTMHSRDA